TAPHVHFESSRSADTLPAPDPPSLSSTSPDSLDASDSLDSLRRFLNVASRADWLRCLALLLSACLPSFPPPVLPFPRPPSSLHLVSSPACTVKPFAARILVTLIDPSPVNLPPLPNSVRQLHTQILHNWILAFDHISKLPPSLTDELCRLASGVGVALRQPG